MQGKLTYLALESAADETLTTQQVNRCHGSSPVIAGFVLMISRIWLVVISTPSSPMPQLWNRRHHLSIWQLLPQLVDQVPGQHH